MDFSPYKTYRKLAKNLKDGEVFIRKTNDVYKCYLVTIDTQYSPDEGKYDIWVQEMTLEQLQEYFKSSDTSFFDPMKQEVFESDIFSFEVTCLEKSSS